VTRRAGLIIRAIYCVCLLGATVNHARAVHAYGWLPATLPLVTALYWAALTFLDPIAVVLLFLRPRIGIAATGAIIISDVLHNLWFRGRHPIAGSLFRDVTSDPFMMSQIAFLLFVAATAPVAWKACSLPAPEQA
jgi:hypothetical protein